MPEENGLSDVVVGERLRIAREAAQITQAAAASLVEVARTTLVAIEKGQRRVRTDELQRLAAAYGTSANAILRQEAIHLDVAPRFRRLEDADTPDVNNAASLLRNLVQAEVELENALGVRRDRNYPPERPLLPGDVREQAEDDAQTLRDWLGLGLAPILDIVSVLDLQLGIRLFIRPLKGKVSGLFIYDDQVGACMLLNANHPAERVAQTAAHETGHFVATRREPEVLTDDEIATSREEKYANAFGRAFLTPARSVRKRFAEITAGQSHLTRRHIILLAHTFGVAREAMVRRLEELRLARYGTWDWFEANGGITNADAEQVLGETYARQSYRLEATGLLPPRLALLAREAWKRDLYSEGQLGSMLHLTVRQIREVLDGAEGEESEANELFKLPR